MCRPSPYPFQAAPRAKAVAGPPEAPRRIDAMLGWAHGSSAGERSRAPMAYASLGSQGARGLR